MHLVLKCHASFSQQLQLSEVTGTTFTWGQITLNKPPVETKTKVLFQYEEDILKRKPFVLVSTGGLQQGDLSPCSDNRLEGQCNGQLVYNIYRVDPKGGPVVLSYSQAEPGKYLLAT